MQFNHKTSHSCVCGCVEEDGAREDERLRNGKDRGTPHHALHIDCKYIINTSKPLHVHITYTTEKYYTFTRLQKLQSPNKTWKGLFWKNGSPAREETMQ